MAGAGGGSMNVGPSSAPRSSVASSARAAGSAAVSAGSEIHVHIHTEAVIADDYSVKTLARKVGEKLQQEKERLGGT